MFATPTVVGDLVYVGSCSGILFALERASGRPRWSQDVRHNGQSTSFHGDPLIFDSTIVIGTDAGEAGSFAGEIVAFDLAGGRLVWKHSATDGIVSDIVRVGDRVLAITRADSLLCLDGASGARVWSFWGGGTPGPAIHRSPAVAQGRVFFGDSDGRCHALDAGSGRVLWSRDLRDRITTGILLHRDALFLGTLDGDLVRLAPATGEIEARLKLGESVLGPPTPAGDSLIVMAGQRSLIAVESSLARVRWRQSLPDPLSSSRPYIWQGMVLAGTERGELLAFRAADGLPRWTRSIEGMIRGIGTSERVFYVGTFKGEIHAVLAPRPTTGGRWPAGR